MSTDDSFLDQAISKAMIFKAAQPKQHISETSNKAIASLQKYQDDMFMLIFLKLFEFHSNAAVRLYRFSAEAQSRYNYSVDQHANYFNQLWQIRQELQDNLHLHSSQNYTSKEIGSMKNG